MWLRDSANQVQSYLPLLEASDSAHSLASLYRGVINLQARYILTDPYCNAFQPPVESGIPPSDNDAASEDTVTPKYNNQSVFECKYELDSLAAFLEVSRNYYNATQDISFFKKYNWVSAISSIMDVAEGQMIPTYQPNGNVSVLDYTFTRFTDRASETTENDGLGNPVDSGTGLIRSFFRPSDDATIFQFLVPSNMMFATFLEPCADIMAQIDGCSHLANRMRQLVTSLRQSIEAHAVSHSKKYGSFYPYEVDGYMGQNVMDDANIPSLLAAPFYGYLDVNDETYQNTRKLILSADNPYFMRGPVISAIGGPHNGPGYAWPMASIVQILTSTDDGEIVRQLGEIVGSTDGLGLIHESINSFNSSDWTRQCSSSHALALNKQIADLCAGFSWANGLFGQMILDLDNRKPGLLKQSFQGNGSYSV
ncbi:uncharacterized protein LTR77_000969 [Saxophila tyrrhenica]|uniref:Glycoside hydrolase family 125 protein n=1 Tax=Saxophila tyrrhenica TaxID=1690608 RepID=A0AAV9PPI0_9PEZI|nr:hypothetical protein LTR77_000969 [Saxophila tyrrhenica]